MDPNILCCMAMSQWAEHKSQVPDSIVLLRIGDFYETFNDDAKTISRVLGLTLSYREHGVPLAGLPYKYLDKYMDKLVNVGFKVAIIE